MRWDLAAEAVSKVENDIGSATGASITRYWSGALRAHAERRWRNVLLRVKWVENP